MVWGSGFRVRGVGLRARARALGFRKLLQCRTSTCVSDKALRSGNEHGRME